MGVRSRDRTCAGGDGVAGSINEKIVVRSMEVTRPTDTRGMGEMRMQWIVGSRKTAH